MAMQQRGCRSRQDLFGLVEFVDLKASEARDLLERQFGEQLEQAADVAVFAVAPELPVIIRGHCLVVEPNRAGFGLAHLGSRGRRQQRRCQRKQLNVEQPAAEVDAVDGVATLVSSAYLQYESMAFVELSDIV